MKFLMILSFLLSVLGLKAKTPKALVDRVEPAYWFAGMKQTSLQLMVYGQGIRDAEVSVGPYAGVSLHEAVRLESPNYQLLYLDVERSAQPGQFPIQLTLGKRKQTLTYELRQRDRKPEERTSFDAHDVLYMLMPDRFASGRGQTEPIPGMQPYVVDRTAPSLRHGGDLEGIRQHLDYFNELGVTALWVTPVLENNSPDRAGQSTYHGYATTDYYRVDPRFGTNEDYRRLVDDCHSHGLKFVMDMIFNHTGFEHPWNQDRPAKDWFNGPTPVLPTGAEATVPPSESSEVVLRAADGTPYLQTSYKLTPVLDPYASDIDLHETTDGWFVPTMPDLNQRNPHVMRYLVQNSKWWIETVGIDGIRMDTYPYADRQAMTDWMRELTDEYPHFNVVGETWVTEPAYTSTWQKGSPNTRLDSHLPTVMDFAFFDRLTQAAGEETDGWWNGMNRIYNNFVYDYLYPDPSHVMAFIENHDTDRFLKNGRDVPMLQQALTLLLTTRRIPQLYYGTEVLMGGTKEVTDGNVRKDFPGGWPGDERSAFTANGRTQDEQAMFQWLSRLLHWRQGSRAVCEGTMKHFCPYHGCYVYARQAEGETVLVILNGTTQPVTLPLERFAEVIGSHQKGTDVTSGRQFDLTKPLQLKQRENLVLVL